MRTWRSPFKSLRRDSAFSIRWGCCHGELCCSWYNLLRKISTSTTSVSKIHMMREELIPFKTSWMEEEQLTCIGYDHSLFFAKFPTTSHRQRLEDSILCRHGRKSIITHWRSKPFPLWRQQLRRRMFFLTLWGTSDSFSWNTLYYMYSTWCCT